MDITATLDREEVAPSIDALVESARSGDDEGWRQLILRLSPMMRGVASQTGLAHDDQIDAVQATWAQCYSHIHTLREPAALPGWLKVSCRREAWKIRRRAQRCVPVGEDLTPARGCLPLPTLDAEQPGPEETVVRQETLQQLATALAALADRRRDLLLTLMETEDYRETARRLGMPVGSIGPTRQRAICDIRRQLEALGFLAA